MHVQEIQVTYHNVWKLTTNKHMLVLNLMFLRQTPFLIEAI